MSQAPGISTKILIAEDDPVSRRALEATLTRWGYEVVVTADGDAAWGALGGEESPRLAILDWMMPGLDGVEICRRVSALDRPTRPYLILLTARGQGEDVVAGLEAGADDYIVKPFDRTELRARLQVGERTLALQERLAERVAELEKALAQVRELQGLLPMCAWCRKIRNDQNYWQDLESYVVQQLDARISHGICPECRAKMRARPPEA